MLIFSSCAVDLPLVVRSCRLSLVELWSLSLIETDYQERDAERTGTIALCVALRVGEERRQRGEKRERERGGREGGEGKEGGGEGGRERG